MDSKNNLSIFSPASFNDFSYAPGDQLANKPLEAFFSSSQRRVTGEVSFSLKPGNFFITGVKSKHSLLSASSGKYGEKIGDWSSEDAKGFSNILSISGSLQSIASGE